MKKKEIWQEVIDCHLEGVFKHRRVEILARENSEQAAAEIDQYIQGRSLELMEEYEKVGEQEMVVIALREMADILFRR